MDTITQRMAELVESDSLTQEEFVALNELQRLHSESAFAEVIKKNRDALKLPDDKEAPDQVAVQAAALEARNNYIIKVLEDDKNHLSEPTRHHLSSQKAAIAAYINTKLNNTTVILEEDIDNDLMLEIRQRLKESEYLDYLALDEEERTLELVEEKKTDKTLLSAKINDSKETDEDHYFLDKLANQSMSAEVFRQFCNEWKVRGDYESYEALKRAAAIKQINILKGYIKKVDDLDRINAMLKEGFHATIQYKNKEINVFQSVALDAIEPLVAELNIQREKLITIEVGKQIEACQKEHSELHAFLSQKQVQIISKLKNTKALNFSNLKKLFNQLREAVTEAAFITASQSIGIPKNEIENQKILKIIKENSIAEYKPRHNRAGEDSGSVIINNEQVKKLDNLFRNEKSYRRFKTYLQYAKDRAEDKVLSPDAIKLKALNSRLNRLKGDLSEYNAFFTSGNEVRDLGNTRKWQDDIPRNIKLIKKIQKKIQKQLSPDYKATQITYNTGDKQNMFAVAAVSFEDAIIEAKKLAGFSPADAEKSEIPFTTIHSAAIPPKEVDAKEKFVAIPISGFTNDKKTIKAAALRVQHQGDTDKPEATSYLIITKEQLANIETEKRIGIWNHIPGKAAMTLAAACVENHIKIAPFGAPLRIFNPEAIGKTCVEAMMIYSQYIGKRCVVDGPCKKISEGQVGTFTNFWEKEHPNLIGKVTQKEIELELREATREITHARRLGG